MKQLICGILLLISMSLGSQVRITSYQVTTVHTVKDIKVRSNFVPSYTLGVLDVPKTAHPVVKGQQNIKAVMPDREQTKVGPTKDSVPVRSDYPERVYEIDYLTSKKLNDEVFKRK